MRSRGLADGNGAATSAALSTKRSLCQHCRHMPCGVGGYEEGDTKRGIRRGGYEEGDTKRGIRRGGYEEGDTKRGIRRGGYEEGERE